MRHGKKFNHLGRTTSHRKAMLSNMASSLIKYKRINTTVAKAKALRKYVEPLITKAKENSTNSRRVVFEYLQDKESIIELFGDVAEKVANRPGGYTRILKTGSRLGDNAEMCIMELVDYNELLLEEAKPKTAKRSRRSKAKSTSSAETAVVEEAQVVTSEVEVKDESMVDPEPEADTSSDEEDKKD
jgi:large subunit ribosomal protein L17|tara:strand:- start:2990 stop:3547 length:558 start_codon:yes stop_codon:yes gene_type:complete